MIQLQQPPKLSFNERQSKLNPNELEMLGLLNWIVALMNISEYDITQREAVSRDNF